MDITTKDILLSEVFYLIDTHISEMKNNQNIKGIEASYDIPHLIHMYEWIIKDSMGLVDSKDIPPDRAYYDLATNKFTDMINEDKLPSVSKDT